MSNNIVVDLIDLITKCDSQVFKPLALYALANEREDIEDLFLTASTLTEENIKGLAAVVAAYKDGDPEVHRIFDLDDTDIEACGRSMRNYVNEHRAATIA